MLGLGNSEETESCNSSPYPPHRTWASGDQRPVGAGNMSAEQETFTGCQASWLPQIVSFPEQQKQAGSSRFMQAEGSGRRPAVSLCVVPTPVSNSKT